MAQDCPAALIVEDQPFVGLVAADILKEAGLETLHASDAGEAVALLRSHPEIGVIVTEADLPGGIDGLELSRQICAIRPDVQLIVTSANREIGASEIPSGARVLRKPYASAELRTLVAGLTLLDA